MAGLSNKDFHNSQHRLPGNAVINDHDNTNKITYNFRNHFHPHVESLLSQLNRHSVAGLMDANFHTELLHNFFENIYEPTTNDPSLEVKPEPAQIDVAPYGGYSGYNWEMFFHVPLTVAVHLSKQQRFAEAQRWFHYVFDPTSTDMNIPAPERFWKFLAFRQGNNVLLIDQMLRVLAKPAEDCSEEELQLKENMRISIEGWRNKPFQPHVIARTRFGAFQFQVVIKYLDNLVAWGDMLFRQDTIETINEATQMYVLAANILGPKPQELPRRGTTRSQTFHSLRGRLDSFGNALVELEGEFPFNQFMPGVEKADLDQIKTLLGIGDSLYFCIPRNEKLMGYWDLVADRLFKIRHCMNIEGVVRQLPLFEPPIDPGMLVKAVAAGIDISSVVNGLNQSSSPVRPMFLIQKALEICTEVRGLGANLLSALEKKDGEALGLLRQKQDLAMQEMQRDVRFLQWKDSEANTDALVGSRESAYQRYRHYQILMGKDEESISNLGTLTLTRRSLLEGGDAEEISSNFDSIYSELITQYASAITLEDYPPKEQAGGASPAVQSSAVGPGKLNLNLSEDKELNTHLPTARDTRLAASVADTLGAVLALIPEFNVNLHYWGMGTSADIAGGTKMADAAKIGAEILRTISAWEQDQAGMASRTASYERRAEDWILQSNSAAMEMVQIGRQIIGSLIREQITKKEYENQIRQIELSQQVDDFLRNKFTNEELYVWMQSELSKVYYECYKFAFDTAKQAERAMKSQLMRPELDQRDFLKFNYWDGGRKGFLSGENLYLDLKRMELAYYEHNKREYELVKHISLRQLNPVALLRLKATGICEVKVPEWVYDLDCPGHYLRRIKTVAVSIPSIAGPNTSINCTISLQKSTIRKSPLLRDGEYLRDLENEDDRFIDYYGTIQSVVTSSAQNDSGLFEVNLQDERLLPFEGSGAESTWRLELPADLRQFNYDTISDIILHIRYTARQAGDQVKTMAQSSIRDMIAEATTSGLVRLFSLRHDFPNEWHKYASSISENFQAMIRKDFFPYFTQGFTIEATNFKLYRIEDKSLVPLPLTVVEFADGPLGPGELRHQLDLLNEDERQGVLEIGQSTFGKDKEVFLLVDYTLS